jgi:protein ImuB
LPEAKFRWVEALRLERPSRADPRPLGADQPLVRRFCRKPVPLSARFDSEPGGVLVHAGERLMLTGPYRVSGGWWVRDVTRDYYYARAQTGALWWVFYDAQRAGWFLQATVD